MLLAATYISTWAEGDVFSACSIQPETQSLVNVDASDDGEHYEHLQREEVEVDINGALIYLEASQGELTESGKQTLKQALGM